MFIDRMVSVHTALSMEWLHLHVIISKLIVIGIPINGTWLQVKTYSRPRSWWAIFVMIYICAQGPTPDKVSMKQTKLGRCGMLIKKQEE